MPYHAPRVALISTAPGIEGNTVDVERVVFTLDESDTTRAIGALCDALRSTYSATHPADERAELRDLERALARLDSAADSLRLRSWILEARSMAREHVGNAVSWLSPGDAETALSMLDAIANGDPRVEEYLPVQPNLSGEMADDPTPLSLAREITGDDDPEPEIVERLADEYDSTVSEAFEPECERVLRAFID